MSDSGTGQRRPVSRTADRKFPGIGGRRHIQRHIFFCREAVIRQGAAGFRLGLPQGMAAVLVGFYGRIWCSGPDRAVIPEGTLAAIGRCRLGVYGTFQMLIRTDVSL